MVFNSLQYLIFFPIVLLCFYIVPQRLKNAWLLIASYVFYAMWNVKYCLILFVCTLITYAAALGISLCRNRMTCCGGNKCKRETKADSLQDAGVNDDVNMTAVSGYVKRDTTDRTSLKRLNQAVSCSRGGGSRTSNARLIFIASLVITIGILAVFKYTDFVIQNLNIILHMSGSAAELPKSGIVLPVGISFFTFQSAGYLIDIYRGEYKAERNFINYALFVSFFPQLLSGPIGRGGSLLPQYKAAKTFNTDNLLRGGEHFLWGIFLKLVIADRAAILVNTVYNDYYSHTGMAIILATVMYGLQIYADFDGYSHMAIGSARMLGIELPENFNTPYLSSSIKEFWRRWHISLSTWLRDYVYFSVGGGRCSRLRKYFNLMLTFLVSGIWHGAKWSFITWGLLHGAYQVIGDILMPLRLKICKLLKVNTEAESFKVCRMIFTFCLADFAWLFFRADGLRNALRMIKRIIFELQPLSLMDGNLYSLGLDEKSFRLLIYSALILLITDICKYRGIDLKEVFLKQNWLFKELSVVVFILFIVVFGVWGGTYDAASFIYFNF